MVDDKYIGLALAVSSSIAIGTSFIITKKVSYILFGYSIRVLTWPCAGSERCSRPFGIHICVRHIFISQKSNMVGGYFNE